MPWVVREEPWYGIEVEYCEVTGQLLPRRYWEFEHDGRIIKARDPRSEALFRDYILGAGSPARSSGETQAGTRSRRRGATEREWR